jgi:hypothetical protein
VGSCIPARTRDTHSRSSLDLRLVQSFTGLEPESVEIRAIERGERCSRIGNSDAERLRETGRTSRKVSLTDGTAGATCGAALTRDLDSVHYLTRSQQDRGCAPLRSAHQIDARVHSVGEVGIDVAGAQKHRPGARGFATEGMGARVVGTAVRLDLGESDRDTAGVHQGAQQSRGHLQRVAREQGNGNRVRIRVGREFDHGV